MIHQVKTSAGVSNGIIKHKLTQYTNLEKCKENEMKNTTIQSGNIGGVGQGDGASQIERLSLLLVLLPVFKAFSEGTKLVDLDGLFGDILPMISYVNNNSIATTMPSKMDVETIFQQTGKEMLH